MTNSSHGQFVTVNLSHIEPITYCQLVKNGRA